MPNRLDGKVALVTGASRGIGQAAALGLAQAGANVAVNYHDSAESAAGHNNAADATRLVNDIRTLGRKSLAVPADVSIKPDVANMVAAVHSELGGIDILVNNAGLLHFHDFLDMPEQLWDRVHQVNLKGTFLCSQAVANLMVKQAHGGRIISISSISALVGGAQQTHYTPTKAGIHSLMQSMAITLGPHGITCNSIMPGTIATDINADDLADKTKRAHITSRIPLGRIGKPDDIAGPVVFLASDQARYITGASLLVDGGLYVNLQ